MRFAVTIGRLRQALGPRDLAQPLLILAIVAGLYLFGALNFIDRELASTRFGFVQRAATADLVVVGIDPRSLKALETWPWSRGVHAKVLDNLLAAGARRVAFDVDFSTASTPDGDARLAEALRAAGKRAILVSFHQLQRGPHGEQVVETTPLPMFAEPVTLATTNVFPESDGLVWRMPVGATAIGTRSLPAVLAGIDSRDAGFFNIDYGIDLETIPQLSYVDVLRGNFDPAAVAGKQVVIGATAIELGDQLPTPIYRSLSGVLVHALGYQSLVQGRALYGAGAPPVLLVCLAIALWAGSRFRECDWRCGLAFAAFGAFAAFAVSVIVQAVSPMLLDTAPVMVLLAMLFGYGLISRIDRQSLMLLVQGRKLQRTDTLMRNVVESSLDGVLTFDAVGRIRSANAAAEKILAAERAALLNTDIQTLFAELPVRRRGSGEVTIAGGYYEVGARRPDGTEFPAGLAISETRFDGDRVLIAILRDNTLQRKHEAELERLALHDALTQLPNRTLLGDRLEHALRLAQRDNRQVGLMFLDLDRFKEVNDTLGHDVGDKVLVEVAHRLTEAVRGADTVARLGGDEFAVALPALRGVMEAEDVAARILAAVAEPFHISGLTLDVGASIGVALYPEHGTTANRLLQCADVAMYLAKRTQAGYALYDAKADTNSVRHLALSGDLRRAIEQEQIAFHYQPKIDLATRRIIGVEALARWHDEEHGHVAPDEFIDIAEKTGLIGPLTQLSLARAFAQMASWRQAGLDIGIAVNLSARMLHDDGLPEMLSSLAQGWNVPPASLTLEVTETAMMLDPEYSVAVTQRLSALGFRLSVDDFGTGHSSLAYLKRLPLNELKIDRVFVMNMTEDVNDMAIVSSTIDLAHNLGLKVVAEGVESEAHMSRLTALGCDIGQGYLYAKPMASETLATWLEDSPWGAARASVEAA